jgi:exodeoxyribonuclease VII large subunit
MRETQYDVGAGALDWAPMSASYPLFDSPRRPSSTPAHRTLWSISELNARIRGVLEGEFGEVGVEGEISNLARPRSGHVYLSLKDNGAQIRAVVWKSTAERLVFELQDGLAVRAWGGVTVYEPRGEYQLVVRRMEPAGTGAFDLAFRQIVARLQAEGLFATERKRPLPSYPSCIAIVSSPTGAAVRDVIRVATARWPLAELVVVPSRVQGDGAARQLSEALATANRIERADLIILTRGGGSLEDLWAFNDEQLARAIVASRLPVVSAVGHEIDMSVADLAADLRAPTPSAAGALCVPDTLEVRQRLETLGQRLARVLRHRVDQTRQRLDGLDQRSKHALVRLVEQRERRIESLKQRLEHAMGRCLDRRHRGLAHLKAGLVALSPLAVLSRGYSLTLDKAGRLIRDSASVDIGDQVTTRLGSGGFESRVEAVEAGDVKR